MAPVAINTDLIRKILKRDNAHILSYYAVKKSLTKPMKDTVCRTVARYMIKKLHGKHPLVPQKHKIKSAICGVFKKAFPNDKVLLPKNSRKGKLGEAFKNAVAWYEKEFAVLDEEEDEEESQNEEMDVEEAEDEEGMAMEENEGSETEESEAVTEDDQVIEDSDENIRFLRHVVASSATRPMIIRSLEESLDFRRDAIMSGSLNFFFDIFRHDPTLILHDFELIWPEKAASFVGNQETFYLFVADLVRSSRKNMNSITILSNETAPFQQLIILLGRAVPGGVVKAVSDFLKTAHGQASAAELEALCAGTTYPFVIAKMSNPIQYAVNFDGKPIYLPPERFTHFVDVFDLLFKVFFVYNIQFPQNLKKFYGFFAQAVYELQPVDESSSVLLEIVDQYQNFGEEGSESDDLAGANSDDLEDESDSMEENGAEAVQDDDTEDEIESEQSGETE